MLKFNNVNIFYGDVQVVFDASFEVNEGEVVALIGANAAGKSTIINAISGINKIESGQIEFMGENIANGKPHKIVEEGLIQIAEGRRLFTHLTVIENLELGGYAKMPRAKVADNMKRVFELFPILEERQTQLAHSLSGGEQQMLAIGRGLMSMPKLLMLDEPSLGLSPMLVTQVLATIEKISKEGMTILLVEQNVRQSLKLADRAYVLENGKVVLEGAADELIDNPHLKKAYLGVL